MLKRLFIIILLVLAPPAMADADRVRDYVVRELREDGFTDIRMSRTWLGRMRFVAETRNRRREIVVNPVTGVILRDYIRWLTDDDEEQGAPGEETGEEEDDDEDDDDDEDGDDDESDDDDDDDDDEDDNSGSGSSNSGSGSDNSGSGSSNSGSGSDDDD